MKPSHLTRMLSSRVSLPDRLCFFTAHKAPQMTLSQACFFYDLATQALHCMLHFGFRRCFTKLLWYIRTESDSRSCPAETAKLTPVFILVALPCAARPTLAQ
eukprot:2821011-Pleurochrysis_carterae.AAC.1